MDFIQLFRDLGIFGLAMFFIQLLLTKSADRKFQSYKTELDLKTREFQSMLDSKIQLYRAELDLQNYKFTQIYERQLNVFIDLHGKISDLNREMMNMTKTIKFTQANDIEAEKEDVETINKIGELYNDLLEYFQKNMIFIPENTATKINSLLDEYSENINNLMIGKKIGSRKEFAIINAEAGKIIREKIPPALAQLVMDFQHLIGVKNTKK